MILLHTYFELAVTRNDTMRVYTPAVAAVIVAKLTDVKIRFLVEKLVCLSFIRAHFGVEFLSFFSRVPFPHEKQIFQIQWLACNDSDTFSSDPV